VPFGIKDDLYAEETAVFLSSASKGLSIPTYGSIKRWKDKGIFQLSVRGGCNVLGLV